MAKIFLCYRSEDDAYAAALLDEKLSEIFGAREIFRASRSVQPGESYSEAIVRTLESCETVLAIIGPMWKKYIEKSGNHSPATPDDWVRYEIATALSHSKRVIPILLSRTTRLDAYDLPPDIAELAFRQYLKFEHRNIEMDIARLVATLRGTNPVAHDVQLLKPPDTSDDFVDNRQEFAIQREKGDDGRIELDVVCRDEQGAITGRLTGRAQPADLLHMAALIAESSAMGNC